MCGLRVTVEPAPANPHTNKRVDFTARGLLANGGVTLYGDTVVTTVTCKSHADDAAIVDGAAAAKAAASKVGKHRDLVLADNPDNRFLPFAVWRREAALGPTPRPTSTRLSVRAPQTRRPGALPRRTACVPLPSLRRRASLACLRAAVSPPLVARHPTGRSRPRRLPSRTLRTSPLPSTRSLLISSN